MQCNILLAFFYWPSILLPPAAAGMMGSDLVASISLNRRKCRQKKKWWEFESSPTVSRKKEAKLLSSSPSPLDRGFFKWWLAEKNALERWDDFLFLFYSSGGSKKESIFTRCLSVDIVHSKLSSQKKNLSPSSIALESNSSSRFDFGRRNGEEKKAATDNDGKRAEKKVAVAAAAATNASNPREVRARTRPAATSPFSCAGSSSSSGSGSSARSLTPSRQTQLKFCR